MKELRMEAVLRLPMKEGETKEQAEDRLIDMMENQDHFSEIGDELKPWYRHTHIIIKQIMG